MDRRQKIQFVATTLRASHLGGFVLLIGLLLAACAFSRDIQEDAQPEQPTATSTTNLPNPASVYCQEQGYTLEIRTAEDGSQQGVCVFPDGRECDEWAYFREECGPGSQEKARSTPAPPTAAGIDTTGWSVYTHPSYGFSFRYPPEWTLDVVQEPDNTMSGHQIILTTQAGEGQPVRMLIGFKRLGEDQLLWPTGVGEGEFVQQGTVYFLDQALNRNVLVCQEQVMNVFYQQEGGVKRGDLEFSLILDTLANCQEGLSIPAEIQQVADGIAGSFELQD